MQNGQTILYSKPDVAEFDSSITNYQFELENYYLFEMSVHPFSNCQSHDKKITKVFIDQKETAVMTTDNTTVNI